MRFLFSVFFVFGISIGCLSDFSEVVADDVKVSDTGSGMEIADRLYLERDREGQLVKAILLYKTLLGDIGDSDFEVSYEVSWKLARAVSELVYFSSLTGEKMSDLFDEAGDVMDAAQKVFPDRFDGYYWEAVLLGRSNDIPGGGLSLGQVMELEAMAKKAMAIQPENPGVYFILAKVYFNAPSFISIGDKDKARDMIDRALVLAPGQHLFYLQSGEIYLEDDEDRLALEAFDNVLRLPVLEREYPATVSRNRVEAQGFIDRM